MLFRKLSTYTAVMVLGFSGAVQAQVAPRSDPTQGAYVLGPGDEIAIRAINADEISDQPVRIDNNGEINLPMVGRIHAAGKTLETLEDEIKERLKIYILQPDLAVSVTEFQSQPVSVLGAVGRPGVVQLEGRKTLLEILTLSGGLEEGHGSTITITRMNEYGTIPLESATPVEPDHNTAQVSVRSLMNASRPQDNILIMPYDVISVSEAELVYVMGDVVRPGGFVIDERGTMSVLQALALAQGIGPDARGQDSGIIRPVPGGESVFIEVNVRDLLAAKKGVVDVMLQPDDILLVPTSLARGTLRSVMDSTVRALTNVAIYGGF